jgi:cysteine-rich repeat protein
MSGWTRPLYLFGTTAFGLASLLPSCGKGDHSVDVVVDVDDPGATTGSPPATAQGGRTSSGRGGSSNGTSKGGMGQSSSGGKSSSNNNSGGTDTDTGGNGGADSDTGGKDGGDTGGKDSGTGGKATETGECGNGKREGDEECDDGDTQNDDGCTADCKYFCESCGCEQCITEKCSNNGSTDPNTGEVVFVNLVEKCFEAEGSGTLGPALGIPKAELCSDIVSCVRSSGCAQEAEGQQLEAEWCYSGIPQAEWAPEKMNGKCKEQFLLGAETGEDADVQERWSDVNYSIGRAVQLLICESEFCAAQCGLKTE